MTSKNVIISILVALFIGVSAFYGGTLYEKNSLTSEGTLRNANRSGFGQGQASQSQGGLQGRNGMGTGGRNNGNFTTGQILSKDDKSITVKIPDGGSKIVYFSDSTQVGKTVDGSAAELNSGLNVMVNGTGNSDGSLTAQNIQIRPDQPK
jgi:hypothetical protein